MIINTLTPRIKYFISSAIIGFCIFMISYNSHAMVIHNCLDTGVGVKIKGQSTRKSWKFRVEPGKSKSIDTGRSELFRLNLNPIGPDKQFSNRKGDEIISMKRIAGNLELVSGNKCTSKPEPVKETGDKKRGKGFCITNSSGAEFCFSKN